MTSIIKFSNGKTLEVKPDANLSESADITTCPVLFGCRTGICGTCLVLVTSGSENITKACEDELELLSIIAVDQPNARLACQFRVKGDIELEYLGK
ncbi:MAG: (2Fe-2S)-binding protein [Bacteriovoracaceae bacterium]|nr:(2Fe-2S)-binding protein [Bacteriovoracaceae bacterium]